MSKFALGFIVSVAGALAMPNALSARTTSTDSKAEAASTDSASAAPTDKEAQQKLKEHLRLRNHIVKKVKYPATKESVVASLKNARDVKPDDKKWVEETLSERTYDTSDDVVKALGWEVAPAPTAKEGK
jgi:hypothetical protein